VDEGNGDALDLRHPSDHLAILTVLVTLRRTQRLYAETDQRLAAEESLRQAQRLDAIRA
jgi:hypothetical protein